MGKIIEMLKRFFRWLAALLGDESKDRGESSNEYADLAKLFYPRRYFFTTAENKFFQVLRKVVGEHYLIFPKARLADVVQYRNRGFNRISQMHVDFLLVTPTDFEPKVAIELNDSSHDGEKQQARDNKKRAVLKAAGVALVEVPVSSSYDPRELGTMIVEAVKSK